MGQRFLHGAGSLRTGVPKRGPGAEPRSGSGKGANGEGTLICQGAVAPWSAKGCGPLVPFGAVTVLTEYWRPKHYLQLNYKLNDYKVQPSASAMDHANRDATGVYGSMALVPRKLAY